MDFLRKPHKVHRKYTRKDTWKFGHFSSEYLPRLALPHSALLVWSQLFVSVGGLHCILRKSSLSAVLFSTLQAARKDYHLHLSRTSSPQRLPGDPPYYN